MMQDEQDEPTTSDDSDMEMPRIIFEDDDSGGHTHCNCHRKCDAMDLGNICRLCLPQSAKHSEKDHKESVFQAVKAVVHAKENEGQKRIVCTTQPQEPPTCNKRHGEDQAESPSKKLKHNTSLVLESAKVKEPLLQECKLWSAGRDQAWIQLRANHTAVINNKDDKKDFTLSCWDFVSGFGRGRLMLLKGENETPKPHQLEFKLENQDDMVLLNNIPISVGKALERQRESKPDAQICYHKTNIDMTDPSKMTFQQTHHVVFENTIDGKVAETSNANFAAKEEYQTWAASDAVRIIWAVRWTAKGLQPIKPVLVLQGSCVVAPGRCLYILGKPAEQS